MTLTQGWNADGEPYSSAFAEIDRANPALYVDCSCEPSLTRQEFADDCDINTLMAKYETTGTINHFNRQTPQYLDLGDVPDLQTSLSILHDATAAFMQLPATVRREFDNDPVKFVQFAADEKNLDKMREWGLAAPIPPEPPIQKVEIINTEPPLDPAAK